MWNNNQIKNIMKIKELFTDKSKWTKYHIACDDGGDYRAPLDPSAICWCLYGAILKCYPPREAKEIVILVEKIVPQGIITFNDAPETAFEQVKELVEKLDV